MSTKPWTTALIKSRFFHFPFAIALTTTSRKNFLLSALIYPCSIMWTLIILTRLYQSTEAQINHWFASDLFSLEQNEEMSKSNGLAFSPPCPSCSLSPTEVLLLVRDSLSCLYLVLSNSCFIATYSSCRLWYDWVKVLCSFWSSANVSSVSLIFFSFRSRNARCEARFWARRR